MSLTALPEVKFCETDAAVTQQSVITTYESISGKSLFPGDPVRLFLEGLAAIIIQQRQVIDFAGKQNLLKYSSDNHLDHLGAFSETTRLQESKAETMVRFSMDTPLAFIVSIASGTRVSPDGQLFFETLDYAEIPAGSTHMDVKVLCQLPGTRGNNFLPGQITRIVDPIPYITEVTNLDTTSGGSDTEEDAPYRERIHLAPERFSVAGPSGAYKYWAMSTHQDIADVAVYRSMPLDTLEGSKVDAVLNALGIDAAALDPEEKKNAISEWLSPAVVNVCPLLTDGEVPDESLINQVKEMVSNKTRRPLTDQVKAFAPETVSFNLDFTYYISGANSVTATEIQAAVGNAVNSFVNWQKEKLGRAINPDRLIHDVIAAGAKRVEMRSPTYQPVNINQVARVETVQAIYGGLEDE